MARKGKLPRLSPAQVKCPNGPSGQLRGLKPEIGATTTEQIREALTAGLIDLTSSAYLSDACLNDTEIIWCLRSLEWLHWHPGKVSAKALAEGAGLWDEYKEHWDS